MFGKSQDLLLNELSWFKTDYLIFLFLSIKVVW